MLEIDENKYGPWRRSWRYMGYELPRIQTAQDAAALLHIAATDLEEIYELGNGFFHGLTRGLDNDGRSIGSIAALFQYKNQLAKEGLALVFAALPAAEECPLSYMAYLNAVARSCPPDYLYQSGVFGKILDFADYICGQKPWVEKPVPFDIRDLSMPETYIETTLAISQNVVPKFPECAPRVIALAVPHFENLRMLESAAASIIQDFASDEQIASLESVIHATYRNSVDETLSYAYKDGRLVDGWKYLAKQIGSAASANPDSARLAMIEEYNASRPRKAEKFPRFFPAAGLVGRIEL